MALDFSAAGRQDLSRSFRPVAVQELLSGVLTMSPHPAWELPRTIDWAANPFGDVNWRSQYHMLRWLEPLRRAALEGDDDAFAMWRRYVRDWVRANPRHAPAHEWVWSDMVDGIRAINLCLAAPLVRDRSPDDLGWLEQTIIDHAEFMADPANLGHANHALHQHEALFVCGRVLGEERYTELAIERFEELLDQAYDDQGINAEGAIAYHYNNYIWYERALKRLDAEGLPRPRAAERHARAPEALAHATRPDGTFVSIGDTDGGSPRGARSTFTTYVASEGAEGEAPPDLLKIYDRGYLFARSGWGETERDFSEETFFSVSFGAADRVHGHPDGGSLTYSAATVNWIVDPGKYQYGGSVPRKHMLSRHSHSLVSLDGMTPQKGAVVHLSSRIVTERSYDFLFTDASFPGVDLTRRIIYSRSGDYLVVIDHIRSPQEVTARQRWQLGPDVSAEIGRQRVTLTAGDQAAVLAFAGSATDLDQRTGSEKPFDGWVATGWKKKVPATAVTASKRGSSFRFITIIGAGNGVTPTVTTTPVEGAVFQLEVATGRATETMVVHPEHVAFPDGPQPGGSPTPAATEALPSRGTSSPLEPDVRRSVFDLLAGARRSARGMTRTEREGLAQQLMEESRALGVTRETDLGLTAAITDLHQTVRGKDDPTVIQPHRTALVNWSQDSRWRPTHYPLPVVHHGSEVTFRRRPGKGQIHTWDIGPLVLPMALEPDRGDTLTVQFQGAVDRAKIRLPIFFRWRFHKELRAGPSLTLADPTLDLSTSMRLGWYLGTDAHDLAPQIAATVQQVAQSLGVRHIVLAGSSGGGFAALQVGAHLPDAIVVAMSPQTDLRQYSRRLVHAASGPAFGAPDLATSSIDPGRLNVPANLTDRSVFPRVELISNPGDKVHVTRHEGPLRDAYEAAGHGTRMRTTEFDLGPGHRSLGNEQYAVFLQELYAAL